MGNRKVKRQIDRTSRYIRNTFPFLLMGFLVDRYIQDRIERGLRFSLPGFSLEEALLKLVFSDLEYVRYRESGNMNLSAEYYQFRNKFLDDLPPAPNDELHPCVQHIECLQENLTLFVETELEKLRDLRKKHQPHLSSVSSSIAGFRGIPLETGEPGNKDASSNSQQEEASVFLHESKKTTNDATTQVRNGATLSTHHLQVLSYRKGTRMAKSSLAEFRQLYAFTEDMLRRGKKVEKRASAIHGFGVFAMESIGNGDFIIEYTGERISTKESDRREKHYKEINMSEDYFFKLDDWVTIDPTKEKTVARFMNHSCEPNCETQVVYTKLLNEDQAQRKSSSKYRRIVVFALRKIEAGEELTYNYNMWTDNEITECHCGAKSCAKQLINGYSVEEWIKQGRSSLEEEMERYEEKIGPKRPRKRK